MRAASPIVAAPPLPFAPLFAVVGWLALYAPLYWQAADGAWKSEDQGHAPIVLAVFGWLMWQLRGALAASPVRPAHALGWPLLMVGLAAYLIGRAFQFPILGFGSQVLVAAALLLLLLGTAGLRTAWFAVLFLVFMVPLPGVFVDASTQSLKQTISQVVTEMLHYFGYPISRSGVTISIGQYQLLVADACSGLHSMFSLTALGSLYIYLVKRSGWLHNFIMLALILPTAFAANLVRVTILILVTFYQGEEAGRGYLHEFAGLSLMLVSLAILFVADVVLLRVLPRGRGSTPAASPT